jgi:chitinase
VNNEVLLRCHVPVQALRAEFDRESAKTGRPRLLLTMAVPAGIEYIDKGYDIPKLNR